ncbi:MAG TPA: hypothetical protein VI756_06000 [Blastocatellia bacterium]
MEKNLDSYPPAVAHALQRQPGGTHQAVKTVMRWTGASERTVKNWFAGNSGPSGRHLVALARHSDEILAMFLALAGRQQTGFAIKLVDVRNRMAAVLEEIDLFVESKQSHK